MSTIEKVKNAKESVKKINVADLAQKALAVVGGVAIVGGATYLITKNIHVEKTAEVVSETVPEVVTEVENVAEAVL